MPRDELHIIITFISYLFISSFIFTFLSSLSCFRDFRYMGRKKNGLLRSKYTANHGKCHICLVTNGT